MMSNKEELYFCEKEYYHSPDIAVPSKIVPVAEVAFLNNNNEVLICKHPERDKWQIPKMKMIPGHDMHYVAESCVTELRVLGIEENMIGLYSDPDIRYYDYSGVVVQELVALYVVKDPCGFLPDSTNGMEWKWIDPESIDSAPLLYSVIEHLRDVKKYLKTHKKNVFSCHCDSSGLACYYEAFNEKIDTLKSSLKAKFDRKIVNIKEAYLNYAEIEEEESKSSYIKDLTKCKFGIIIEDFEDTLANQEMQKFLMQIVEYNLKKQKYTCLITTVDVFENEDMIYPPLFMLIASGFYRRIQGEVDYRVLERMG